jgi:hypothetical protein
MCGPCWNVGSLNGGSRSVQSAVHPKSIIPPIHVSPFRRSARTRWFNAHYDEYGFQPICRVRARDFIPSCQRRRKNASVFRSKNTSVKLKTRSRNLREPARLKAAANRFADKTKDLQALRDAVVDAASIGAGLWLSYLFVLFYLLIAAASVTHRALFFENPIKLPFLNEDLPLVFFFWLGPLLFLIVHTYVLLHFVLLAGKVRTFHIELGAQISDDVRSGLRRQPPSNIFVQFLAGPQDVRTGVIGLMLRLIAQISLVAGPVALLVFFQLQFLPYHNELITWWHRIAAIIDVALLWILWSSVARRENMVHWPFMSGPKVATTFLVSLIPILLVVTIATFPGEWMEQIMPSVPLVPTKWPTWKSQDSQGAQFVSATINSPRKNKPNQGGEVANGFPVSLTFTQNKFMKRITNQLSQMEWTTLHALLVAGDVDLASRKPKSHWSNRLVLPGLDAIDYARFDSEAKFAAVHETVSLREHHLEGAVMIGNSLRKADFTQGADFSAADLREADFSCGGEQTAHRTGSHDQKCAQLQGASLWSANLSGAKLDDAQLQGGFFFRR